MRLIASPLAGLDAIANSTIANNRHIDCREQIRGSGEQDGFALKIRRTISGNSPSRGGVMTAGFRAAGARPYE